MTKEIFLPAFGELSDCIGMVALMLQSVKVNEHILEDDKYSLLFSVEKVNQLVLQGMPFRDAYKQVGLEIEAGQFTSDKKVTHTHEGSIGQLCNDQITEMKTQIIGGFGFEKVNEAVRKLVKS
jgi:argininosuccinate lyase